MDVASEHGLNFVGEYNPVFIQELVVDNRKRMCHETQYQPMLSLDSFVDVLKHHSNSVVLVNSHAYLALPYCDTIILRKNMRQAFASTANFIIKMYPNVKAQVVTHMLERFAYDYFVLNGYVHKYNDKKVVWYEDYYGNLPTKTPMLDVSMHRKAIVSHIDTLVERCHA